MPTTPRFRLRQDDAFVYVVIKVPWIRVSEAELHVDGSAFSFFCKPYLLRLQLPSDVVDDERCRGVYDVDDDHGTITAHLPKAEPGTVFPNLDLKSRLLASVTPAPRGMLPSIEVLSSTAELEGEVGEEEPAARYTERSESDLGYGFCGRYHGVFKTLREEQLDCVKCGHVADALPARDRMALMRQVESAKFDAGRYNADSEDRIRGEDYLYPLMMAHQGPWDVQLKAFKGRAKGQGASGNAFKASFPGFAEEEEETLAKLPRKELLPPGSRDAERLCLSLALSAADMLFGAAYEERFGQGEPGAESAWTAATLSPTLSFLISWHRVYAAEATDRAPEEADKGRVDIPLLRGVAARAREADTLEAHEPLPVADAVRTCVSQCARRALVYPYLRRWDLVKKCLRDVHVMLQLGRRAVLNMLLRLRRRLELSEIHYMLNVLYLNDYCVWAQSDEDVWHVDASLRSLAGMWGSAIKALSKADLGLRHPELSEGHISEHAAGADGNWPASATECDAPAAAGDKLRSQPEDDASQTGRGAMRRLLVEEIGISERPQGDVDNAEVDQTEPVEEADIAEERREEAHEAQ